LLLFADKPPALSDFYWNWPDSFMIVSIYCRILRVDAASVQGREIGIGAPPGLQTDN
jgi:hypothetical protein